MAMQIGLAAAGALAVLLAASAGGTAYFFRSTILRKDSVQLSGGKVQEAGTGPAGMDTATEWNQYVPLITERRKWLLSQEREECFIQSHDGLKLHGTLIPAREKSGRTVIAVHGYRSSGTAFAGICPFFHELGFNILLVDNRAHGESEGRYVGFGCLDQDDCLGWIDYIVRRYGAQSEILLYGVSMGGSTVLLTAGRGDLPAQVKAVVSDCAFTSAWDVFRHVLNHSYHMPSFPVLYAGDLLCRKLAGYGLRDCSTLERVRTARVPVLLMHGKNDTFVPTQMSRDNFEACKEPKKLVLIPDAGHGSAYYAHPEEYERAVREWIGLYIGRQRAGARKDEK